MWFENSSLYSLIITIISELVVLVMIVRGKPLYVVIMYSLLVNSITHPLVFYFVHICNVPLLLAEIVVMSVEALMYRYLLNTKLLNACILSLCANMASIVVGILVWGVVLHTL